MNFEEIWESIKAWLTSTSLINTVARVIISLLILFISFKVINLIARRVEKLSQNKNADKTIVKTLANVIKVGLKIVVVMCLIGFLGIDTSGLTALITSLGVCVGLAVNGALSNLAGGVLLIFTRPFKVDDYIEAQGYEGTVLEIRITNTKIVTPDNKIIYIPNGALSTGVIINYSEENLRRVDLKYEIKKSDDFEKIKAVLDKVCQSHELVLKNPTHTIRIGEHGPSKLILYTRVWVKTEDYWTVYYDMQELVKKAFDENGIELPVEQLDVRVKNDK
ncbi:MAG: mechanosensitive ion channel [Clostridia bacterium]|nr:mechanosensitive ion channel [Clostridia bacterium]